MNKAKEILLSDRGMTIINSLFILSLLIRNRGVVFVFYLVWIAYLAFGMKESQSKAVKIINSIFIIFATIMIIVNVCLLMNAL